MIRDLGYVEPGTTLRLQGVSHAPAGAQAVANVRLRNSKNFRPFSDSHGLAVVLDDPACSSVPALPNSRRPLAILLAVVAVIVNAINLVMRGRSLAHVLKECRKAVQPAVAHANSPAAVVAVGLLVLVVASPLNAAPHFVLWRFGAPVRLDGTCGVPCTTAALRAATDKAGRPGFDLIAAFAGAKPLAAGDETNSGQLSKRVACKIVAASKLPSSHNVSLHSGCVLARAAMPASTGISRLASLYQLTEVAT